MDSLSLMSIQKRVIEMPRIIEELRLSWDCDSEEQKSEIIITMENAALEGNFHGDFTTKPARIRVRPKSKKDLYNILANSLAATGEITHIFAVEDEITLISEGKFDNETILRVVGKVGHILMMFFGYKTVKVHKHHVRER